MTTYFDTYLGTFNLHTSRLYLLVARTHRPVALSHRLTGPPRPCATRRPTPPPQDVLVLRSIIDVNLCKFLAPDVPLFHGITSDLFPGVSVPPPDRSLFKKAFEDVCIMLNIQPTGYLYEKVVQTWDMMVVRHGFMVVGSPFAGKTVAWRALQYLLGLLHDRFPEDPVWTGVLPLVINPKVSVGFSRLPTTYCENIL